MQLTIKGNTFEISAPYVAGTYELSEAEARTLNQTRLENISNNLRKQIEQIAESPEGSEEERRAKMEQLVSAKDAEYTFGMGRQGGGGGAVTRDPVSSEARKLASAKLDEVLKSKGTSLSAQRKLNKEGIEAKIDQIAAMPEFRKAAEKNVQARQKSLASLDSILGDMSTQPAEGTTDMTGGEEVAA